MTSISRTEETAGPAADGAHYRDAMSRMGSSVTIVTSAGPAGPAGFTATAVASVSDDPPTILVCVNRASRSHGPLTMNGVFCINVLADGMADLAEIFAGRGLPDGADTVEERFAHGEWARLATGSAVLVGAVAAFDCHLDREIDSPTHAVLFGRVAALVMAEPPQVGAEPLTYSFGGFGSFVPLAG